MVASVPASSASRHSSGDSPRSSVTSPSRGRGRRERASQRRAREALDVSGRPSPRATLEALLSPDLLSALDEHVRELVDERLADHAAAGDGRDWYTLGDAADVLGCSYDAARQRAKRGRLEVCRQARRVLVSARSIRVRGRELRIREPRLKPPVAAVPLGLGDDPLDALVASRAALLAAKNGVLRQ